MSSAMELNRHGRFFAQGMPEIVRTPGYPLFLALFVGLPKWQIFAVIAQCVIGAAIACLVYGMTKQLWKERAAIISSIVFTISPLTLLYSSALLTERLTAFFIALVCMAMLFFVKKDSFFSLSVAGVMTVCAIFIRPAVLFMPIGVVFFLAIYGAVRKIGVLKTVAYILLFSIITMTPVKLWELRNKRLTTYGGFSAISAINLYFYNGAGVLAALEKSSFPAMLEKMGYYDNEIFYARNPELKNATDAERFGWMEREGRKIILENKKAYADVHIKGMFFTLAMPASGILVRMSWGDEQPGFRKIKEGRSLFGFILALVKQMPLTLLILGISALFIVFYYIFAFIGISTVWHKESMFTLFLVGVVLYFILISGGPAATCRFREPVGFILAMWAGAGLIKFCEKRSL